MRVLIEKLNGKNIDLFKDCNLEKNQNKLLVHSKNIKNDIDRNLLI